MYLSYMAYLNLLKGTYVVKVNILNFWVFELNMLILTIFVELSIDFNSCCWVEYCTLIMINIAGFYLLMFITVEWLESHGLLQHIVFKVNMLILTHVVELKEKIKYVDTNSRSWVELNMLIVTHVVEFNWIWWY